MYECDQFILYPNLPATCRGISILSSGVDPTPLHQNPSFQSNVDHIPNIYWSFHTHLLIRSCHILYDVATGRYRIKELQVIVFRLEDIDILYLPYITSCSWDIIISILTSTNTSWPDLPTQRWETLNPKDKDHLLDLLVMESMTVLYLEVITLEISLLLYVLLFFSFFPLL
jgi:hypothetical protein